MELVGDKGGVDLNSGGRRVEFRVCDVWNLAGTGRGGSLIARLASAGSGDEFRVSWKSRAAAGNGRQRSILACVAAKIRQGVGDAEGMRSVVGTRLGDEAREGFNRTLEGNGDGCGVIRRNLAGVNSAG